jgi:flagellar biosynthesis/type III secretory pathway protein FliH
VIKSRDFAALYAPDGSDSDGTARYRSSGRRAEELERRLAEAEAAHGQAVAEAERRGRAQAEAAARAEWEAAVQAARAAANELRGAAERTREVAQEEMIQMAVAVASKVLRREISRDDEFVVRLVQRCVLRIANRARVEVHVNPQDLAQVREALALPASGGGPAHELVVTEDRRVERGGCVVQTPDFVVDGTVRTQLRAATEALRGNRP